VCLGIPDVPEFFKVLFAFTYHLLTRANPLAVLPRRKEDLYSGTLEFFNDVDRTRLKWIKQK